MYFFMAAFWLVTGILMQVYWTTLQPMMNIPVDRSLMGAIFFIMFTYCVLRWRLARPSERIDEEPKDLPPRPRREYDPTFDFSDSKDKKSEPEA